LENSLVNSVLLQTFALLTAVQRANKAPHRPLHQHLSKKITEADHFKEWLLQWYAMLETIRYKTSDWCAQRESTFFNLFLFIDIFAYCAMCKQSSEPPAPPAPMQKSQKLLASNASAKAAS
jgi:hypothetical protein